MVFFWSISFKHIRMPEYKLNDIAFSKNRVIPLHLVYTNIKLQCKRFVNSKIYYFTDFHLN